MLERLDFVLSWWERLATVPWIVVGVATVTFSLFHVWAVLAEQPLIVHVAVMLGAAASVTILFTYLPSLLRKLTASLSKEKELTIATTLRKSLENQFCEYANARIVFMTMQQQPLASRIADTFKLAGWEVNLVPVPMEPNMQRYISGIEVTGPNRVLVEGVVDSLKRVGFSNITTSMTELIPDHPDNLKWRRIERRVQINIGYQS